MSLQDSIKEFINSIIYDEENDYSELKNFYESETERLNMHQNTLR